MGWSAPVLLVLLAPRPLETAPCGIGAARASPIRHQASGHRLGSAHEFWRFLCGVVASVGGRWHFLHLHVRPSTATTAHGGCACRTDSFRTARRAGASLTTAHSHRNNPVPQAGLVSRACMSSDGCDALSTSASSCWCPSLSFLAGASGGGLSPASASLPLSLSPPSSSCSLSSLLSLSLRARRAATLLRRAGGRRRSDLLVSLGLAPARLRRRL